MEKKSNRRTERVSCQIPVRWMKTAEGIELTALDMNQHGLFLATPATTMPNALMKLVVHLPSGPITVFAVARFVGNTVTGHGIGVEIFVMDERERRTWNAHYRSLLTAHKTASDVAGMRTSIR